MQRTQAPADRLHKQVPSLREGTFVAQCTAVSLGQFTEVCDSKNTKKKRERQAENRNMVLFDVMATAGLRGEARQVWSSGAGLKAQLSHLGAGGPQPPKPGKPQGLPLLSGL